jgi:hypothetical protein
METHGRYLGALRISENCSVRCNCIKVDLIRLKIFFYDWNLYDYKWQGR